MKKNIHLLLLSMVFLFCFCGQAGAFDPVLENLGKRAVQAALAALHAAPETENLACITNAGYVQHNGKSTRCLYDIVSQNARVSPGMGNLLPLHSRLDEPLWLAFVHHRSENELLLTHVCMDGKVPRATEPINIRGQSHC